MTPIVDIHCHTFNADDLPVRGFVHKVAFHEFPLTDDIAALVDRVVQGSAPGYLEDKRKLDNLLGRSIGPEAAVRVAVGSAPLDLDAEAERTLLDLNASDPELVERVGVAMAGGKPPLPGEAVPEGVLDWWGGAKRAIKWATIFGRGRLEVTTALIDNFHGEVDLFTPLLVDLDMGLADNAATSMRQQVVLQEKISRLSMLGLLPSAHQAHVHPFIGFDPRREVVERRAGDLETSLDFLKVAVERYGVIGVKLYTPMGFRPLGNAGEAVPSAGVEVDAVLRELYGWCEQHDVPITTHCNPSNYAREEFKDFPSPDNWAVVLEEFPELRLNLGHFGGASDKPVPADAWPWKVAHLVATYPNLYADVGNHKIYDQATSAAYLALLRSVFEEVPEMAKRIMFGSDWYMVASHPAHDQFLENYRSAYRSAFDAPQTEDFLGRNAIRFLGFDDAAAGSTLRLRARYAAHAPENVPGWLAG